SRAISTCARAKREAAWRWKISRITIVRSITSPPTSFARLNAWEGEISWSIRMSSARSFSRIARSSSRLPVPKYAAFSKPARFCVNLPTTSKPSVLPSWRSSSSEASNSGSLTPGRWTAATMARFRFGSASCVMVSCDEPFQPRSAPPTLVDTRRLLEGVFRAEGSTPGRQGDLGEDAERAVQAGENGAGAGVVGGKAGVYVLGDAGVEDAALALQDVKPPRVRAWRRLTSRAYDFFSGMSSSAQARPTSWFASVLPGIVAQPAFETASPLE